MVKMDENLEQNIQIHDIDDINSGLNRYKHLCRLCLSQPQEIQLFETSQTNFQYSEIIMQLVNIEISKDDKFPQAICEECSSKLILFYKFKQKIELSQCTLSELFVAKKITENFIESNENSFENKDFLKNFQVEAVNEANIRLINENEQHFVQEKIDESDLHEEIEIIEDEYVIEELHEEYGNTISKQLFPEDNTEYSIEIVDDDYVHDNDVDYDNSNSSNGVTFNIFDEQSSNCTDSNAKKEIIENPNISTKRIRLNQNNKNENQFKCELCGHTFGRKSTLMQHSSVHSTEKKFQCEICNQKFTRRGHVTVHMRAHNGIRPYACDQCGRAFTKSGDLSRHKKIHSDIHDYYCSLCGKGFKRAEYLQSHLNMHSGLKPFNCKNCDKEYSSYSSLMKHRKKNNH